MAAADAVFDLIDETVPMRERDRGRSAPSLKNEISFENLSFQYENNPVLREVSIRIPRGEVIAIVGQTGAGKTTILDLVMGFYEPTSGRILWDGINIQEYNPASLRSQMAVVTQQTVLFNDTVAANIAYNLPETPAEQIEAASKTANAYEFITALPEGFKTLIGEDGIKLSGGERQRLAIARAALRDPTLLILDEATSALDAESELLIERALSDLMKGRTTLIVAHRLSSVRRADHILAFEQGQLIEQGTHDSLLAQNGLYARLCNLQSTSSMATQPVKKQKSELERNS